MIMKGLYKEALKLGVVKEMQKNNSKFAFGVLGCSLVAIEAYREYLSILTRPIIMVL